jgi:hypothetical protein
MIDALLGPLDAARRSLLSVAVRAPAVGTLVRRRDARVLARSLAGILLAFGASIVAPGAMLLLSPLVLGVPHVGADVRYLVRRQSLGGRVEASFFGACAALLLLRAAEMVAPVALPYARIELAFAAAWIGSSAIAASRDARSRARAGAIAAMTLGLLALAWPRPDLARVVFAHVHNVVAVLLWATLFYRARRAALVPLTLLAVLVLVTLSGATLPWVVRMHGYAFGGADVFYAADALAPHVTGLLAPSIVLSYVLLQSVHYMAWLVWIPDASNSAQGTPTFRMTARGLLRELGPLGLALLALAGVVVAIAALSDARRARTIFLSLSAFHGYLELAAVAFLTTRAARARAAPGEVAWSASG